MGMCQKGLEAGVRHCSRELLSVGPAFLHKKPVNVHNLIKLRPIYQMDVSVEQSFSLLTAQVDVIHNANQPVFCQHWLLLNMGGCQELAVLKF